MKDLHDNQTIDIEDVVQSQTEQVGDKANSLEDGLVIVDFISRGRDGERTLQEVKMLVDDIEVTGSVVRKGRIEWFPKDALKFKGTLERRAQRLIGSSGIPYGRLTAIPVCDLDKLLDGLSKIKAEFAEKVNDLDLNFDTLIEDHKKANPENASLIDKLKSSKDEFISRFSFEVCPPMAFKPYLADDSEKTSESLSDSLYDEIVKDAEYIHNKLLSGHTEKGQKAINVVRRLRDKVNKLSFIDERFADLVDEMDDILKDVPKSGNVGGLPLKACVGMVSAMTSRERLESCISPSLDIEDPDELNTTSVTDEVTSSSVTDTPANQPISKTGFGEW
ncbi:DUF3150 domain-containing protein [uncultured Photobacterium sp.]|uniref:DUF3150 domain-containing protein n=1 Tax=uncultured Photobacterium sp. TaxID=173973 RepID=UPI002617C7DF|nr:DUF3150 domain-containing protein [uncultured Photobacterium sp.]